MACVLRRARLQQVRQGADLRGAHQGLIGLDVDHMVGTHEAVGFGEAIGAALVCDAGGDRVKAGIGHAAAQQFVVDGEVCYPAACWMVEARG